MPSLLFSKGSLSLLAGKRTALKLLKYTLSRSLFTTCLAFLSIGLYSLYLLEAIFKIKLLKGPPVTMQQISENKQTHPPMATSFSPPKHGSLEVSLLTNSRRAGLLAETIQLQVKKIKARTPNAGGKKTMTRGV